MSELSLKQKTFCDEYLVTLNAADAARKAGYSDRSAYEIGYENLRKPQIQEYIEQKVKERNARTEVTQDNVVREFAKVAFFDPRKLFDSSGRPIPLHELDENTAACIAGIDINRPDNEDQRSEIVKYKLNDKLRSLENLGKHLDIYAADNKKDINLNGEITHKFTSKEVARRIAFVLAKGLRQDE